MYGLFLNWNVLYSAFVLWFDHFLDSWAEIHKKNCCCFWKFKTQKSNSEINWPLVCWCNQDEVQPFLKQNSSSCIYWMKNTSHRNKMWNQFFNWRKAKTEHFIHLCLWFICLILAMKTLLVCFLRMNELSILLFIIRDAVDLYYTKTLFVLHIKAKSYLVIRKKCE